MCDAIGPAFDMMIDGGITFVPQYVDSTPEDNMGIRTGSFFEKTGSDRAVQIQGMLDKYGANCMWNTHATSLITDSTGAVVGVYAEGSDGKVYQINAKGGVVLCCGGFVHNAEMVNDYFSGCEMMSISNTFDDGSGIRMATDVGGQMGKNFSISMYEFSGSNPKDPKTGFFSANDILYPERIGNLFVNKRGDRFMNEQWMVTRTMFCSEPLIREGGKYYMIYDTALMRELSTHSMLEITGDGVLNAPGDVGGIMVAGLTLENIFDEAETAIEQGFCWKADTIEELAQATGLDNLPETISAYNESCDNGTDPQMYKDAGFLRPIKEGPFYAVECVLNAWVTLGGLKTDGDCRVLNASAEPIPGLYVAGADCDAWAVPYYQVTTTSGFSFATAYISAEDAAKRAKA
jgi:fumarate reductase flavoprotein subunit